jgi:hypothetical protein
MSILLLHPYSPFPKPVRPPSENLGDFCLTLDRKWIPYLLGAIAVLAIDTTWQYDIDRVTGEARNLLDLIMQAPTCEIPSQGGTEVDDCMSCCIRIRDGKLQVFSCGEWTTVEGGDLLALAAGASQPAQGQPQPGPGDCESFIGKAIFFGRWLLPVPVSTGDVIKVTNAFGATTDYIVDFPAWRCPDGTEFIANGCVTGTEITNAGDPDPSIPHAALVGFDGTNYYDCSAAANGMTATITIPSGIVNGNFVFLINSEGPAGAGDVSFDARICKASASVARFSHTFDLRASAAGFNITVPGAVPPLAAWIPGVGVQVHNPSGVGGSGALRVARATPRTLHNTVLRVIANTTADPIGNNGVYNMPASNPIAGVPIEFFPNNAHPTVDTTKTFTVDCDAFMVEFDAIFAGDTDTVVTIIISADGTDPF